MLLKVGWVVFGLVLGVVLTLSLSSEKKAEIVYKDRVLDPKDCTKGEYIDEYCSVPVIAKGQYTMLEIALEGYLAEKKRVGHLNTASIYFRDLVDGPTLGINEYESYLPASLFKLPVLITFYSLAENDPSILDKKLKVVVEDDIESLYKKQFYPPSIFLKKDEEYTISYLLERLIVDSDNLALRLLSKELQTIPSENDFVGEVYKELGLFPDFKSQEQMLSTKRYAAIFRTLYFSSYLSPEYSNKALKLLSRTNFAQGLKAGLPEGIAISHKFGERGYIQDGDKEKQLHDCGIIYYPDNPYILCVMTRGEKYEELQKVIADISRMFYEEVDSRKINPN